MNRPQDECASITTVMAKVRHYDFQGTNDALGSGSHMKVNFQFPLKHADSRYSREINFISVQIFEAHFVD